MLIHLKIIGILLILLALLHLGFPKYFNWRQELKSISLINRQMMHAHTFFICLTLVFMGLLCIFFGHDMISTTLGRAISFGFGVFWSIRLFFQWFVYAKVLWYNKRFETAMHVLFTMLWIYLSAVFFTIFFS